MKCAVKIKPNKLHDKQRASRVSIECGVCHKEFTVKPSAKDSAKYCSMICKLKFMEMRFKRENNPNWKGGTYERSGNWWWAKKIKERDGKCFLCETTENLEAHHIHPWKKFKEERLNIENGIALCLKCHKEMHRSI